MTKTCHCEGQGNKVKQGVRVLSCSRRGCRRSLYKLTLHAGERRGKTLEYLQNPKLVAPWLVRNTFTKNWLHVLKPQLWRWIALWLYGETMLLFKTKQNKTKQNKTKKHKLLLKTVLSASYWISIHQKLPREMRKLKVMLLPQRNI